MGESSCGDEGGRASGFVGNGREAVAGGATAMEDSVEQRRASDSAATLDEASSVVTAELSGPARIDAPGLEPAQLDQIAARIEAAVAAMDLSPP